MRMARSDSDSWDLATSVGATATMVAAYRAVATRRGVIDDPFAEPLVRAVGMDVFTQMAGGTAVFADENVQHFFDAMTDGFAARTHYFDNYCADAARTGIRQVAVVASGLDSRPYRLSWPTGTTLYEIDQPEVIEFKAQTLARLGAAPTVDRRTVGIDLREDWPSALQRAGFDAGQSTEWLVEGLLIGFLPPEAHDRLLDNITSLSAPGSRFAGDYVRSMSKFVASQQRMRILADRWQENGLELDIADLTYPGERNDVADYLGARGWSTDRATFEDLFKAAGLPVEHRDDEVESFDWIRYVTATKN
jgi:methyltransferase (TIGR00027 family)